VITLADAKLNLRVDDEVEFEDSLVESLIASATRYLERRTGWHLGTVEERTVYLCGYGAQTMWLPQPPVAESVEIEADGEAVTEFTVRGSRLFLADGWTYGTEYVVTYDAGYAAGSGPPDLMQACRLLVAGWFEDREAWTREMVPTELAHRVRDLTGTYERIRT
jgi:hypothetical protein